MEQRIYRGSIDPNVLAQHLLNTWDQDDTVAQALEGDQGIIVQVGQRSGGLFNSCGTDNTPGAERCRECGTFLQARDCPQCGVSNPATANFCMRCGSSLSRARTVND